MNKVGILQMLSWLSWLSTQSHAKLSDESRILEDVVKIPWVLRLWLTPLNHLLWVKGPVLDGLNAPSLVLSEAVFAKGVSMQLAAEGFLVML